MATNSPPLRSAMKHSSTSLSPSSDSILSPPMTPLFSSTTASSFPISPLQASSVSSSVPVSPALSTSQSLGTQWQNKVSFDTFENPVASMFSFTLNSKSQGYKRTRNTRVFLCASSPDESGREALDWSLESLVQDGDEFVVCRGVEEEVMEKDHDIIREEARELMKQIEAKSVEYEPERKLSIVLEYIPGKITDTLDRLIALYRPDSVVVGTRGRRAWQMGIGKGTMGSVSRYCLAHSPVPIIVVRPERKVKKAIEKRRADPKRGTHFD
ncbi:hypothetical protein C8J56DRAFT_1002181 [Mycena floridula]|nr:hypothetical protein C8J56DRAFT_1002181 [Mycena floridula]